MNKGNDRNPSIFCAGFVIQCVGDEIFVLCVRDIKYSDLKAAGGTSEPGEDLKNPEAILRRELIEEQAVNPIAPQLIHVEPHDNHTKYFYLVVHTETPLPAIGYDKTVTITEVGRAPEKLEVKYYELRQFADRLYRGQHQAFAKMIAELAVDPKFYKKYGDLLTRFPVRT